MDSYILDNLAVVAQNMVIVNSLCPCITIPMHSEIQYTKIVRWSYRISAYW